MTVEELIKALSKYPKDTKVYTDNNLAYLPKPPSTEVYCSQRD